MTTYLIDGTTQLPENGDTGWGTTLNAAITAIDNRFTYTGGNAIANYAAAGSLSGATLASNVLASSLTSVGTLASLAVSGNATVGGNITVTGNLTVNGTTTTINTTTLNVSDNIVVLNNDVTGSPTENAGIEVERGTSTNVLIRWNETTDVWEFTTDGSAYSTFNDASAITGTTLASGVTGSSLTSVGTISSGTWNGTVIAGQYGGTGVNNSGKTITLGGNLTMSGAYNATLTLTNTTTVTLPTSGTLATLDGSESLTNKKLGSLTSNGIVTTSGGDGALSITATTGSGNVVLASTASMTSPAISTSVTTGSSSFDLVNTTATTVNFAGAATTLNIGAATGTTTVNNSLTVTGNLTVNGTTTTVNSTTTTVDDPIFTLGGDSAPGSDDNKDRGVEFNWHNGTDAKVGFFGFDDSTGYFTFIPDATNTSEVFSGTQGDIEASNFRGALIGNASTATALQTARTINGVSFDGTGNISVTLASIDDITDVVVSSPSNGQFLKWDSATSKWINASGTFGAVSFLDDIGDVTITSAASGQLLKWNGTAWVNATYSPVITLGGDLSGSVTLTDLGNATLTATIAANSVALGTDTTGNYMVDLSAGTGVSITHTPGEGSTATVGIGQAVGTSDNVTSASAIGGGVRIGVAASKTIDTATGGLTIDSAGGTTAINDDVTVSGTLSVTGATILGPASINTQTDSYTLILADQGKIVEMNKSTAVNLTVPPESSVPFPTGTQITVVQIGSGQVTFVPGSGVTIYSDSSKTKISTQYSAATLVKRAADTWVLIGNLAS